MGVKYTSEYTNFNGDTFLIEIEQDSFSGVSKEIVATANLEYASVSDVLESIRGSALRVDIEAGQDLVMEDLYSENETEFGVTLEMNGQILFKGFLKPDGLYTDFVNEIYTISLDAVDGLGILKNLSFVQEDGSHYQGYMSEQDIVYYCLKRTSLNLPINVDIGIFQYETSESVNTLKETYLSVDRFIKDDGVTIMDCEEVLRSVLEKYCAVIHQHNGEWYIYRPLDLVKDNSFNFFRYVDNIENILRVEVTPEMNIGSHIKGFVHHHQNKDQRITIDGSISAYRVHYQYGIAKTFFTNPKFIPNTDGTIDGWNIQPNKKFATNNNGGLHYSNLLPSFQKELISDPSMVAVNDLLELSVRITSNGNYTTQEVKVILTDGTQTKYLTYNSFTPVAWSDSDGFIVIDNYYNEWTECSGYEPENVPVGKGDLDFTLDIPPIPFTGQIIIEVYTPDHYTTILPCFIPFQTVKATIKEVKLSPKEKGNDLVKGEFHTVTRVPRSSSIVKDNKTIFIGDMASDIFEGTIKNTSGENTRYWKRRGSPERKGILELMAEETMRISHKPSKVFSGTVSGFIPFLCYLRIDNLLGKHAITNYTYNTNTDSTYITCKEVHSEVLINFEYQKTFDYGEVVTPTISG